MNGERMTNDSLSSKQEVFSREYSLDLASRLERNDWPNAAKQLRLAAAEIERLRAALRRITEVTATTVTLHYHCRQANSIAEEALAGSSADETSASPQAPIAKVRVANRKIVDGKLYSPGLPTGVQANAHRLTPSGHCISADCGNSPEKPGRCNY